MGISPRLLGEGEYVVASTRTHVKALLRPALVLILLCGAGAFAMGLVPQDPPLLKWLIGALVAVGIARWVVWPFLNWLGASYTLTNHRVVTREGVLTRYGHDIPLRRVNDVSYEHGLLDRVLGCGTLVIAAASERGEVVLPDIPAVENLYVAMTELLVDEGHFDVPDQPFPAHDGWSDEGRDDDGQYDGRQWDGYDEGYDDEGYDDRYDGYAGYDGGYDGDNGYEGEARPRLLARWRRRR
jgi:membrane protein YdbS with pleckstrin-like domain